MMDTKSSFGRIASWYQSSSRNSRISLTVILITIVLVLVQFGNWQTATPMCSLLDDCRLRSADIQRIQLALGQSGLDEFKIEGDKIQVPVAQRANYLKAITDHGAVPVHLQDQQDMAANINPFMSRSQQKIIERSEKKRQIREMIERLPFVEQAWFEMDIAESRSAFEPSRQTAVVSVMPKAQKELSPAQVDTIRQIIGGALAGMDSKQLVVTDLSTGRAFPNHAMSSEQYQQESSIDPNDSRRSFFENEIQRALSTYPGLDVQIHYASVSKQQSSSNPPARSASIPNLLADTSKPVDRTSEDSVGANGIASIDDMDGPPAQEPPTQLTTAQIKMSQNMLPITVERVAVSITVPQAAVEARYGSVKAKTLFGFPLEAVPPNLLENKFEKLKSELIEKIRPVLPISSFDNSDSYPISVVFNRHPNDSTIAGWQQVRDLFRSQWPTAAVLLIGLMMLVVVTKSKPVPHSASHNELLSIESAVHESNEVADQAKAEAEQQLSRLIEQDPDTAARVIKSWIRKAA